MIFGENGTGKSSIVDGFSFLCNRDLGSIADRSSVDKDYIAAITGDKKDLSVVLTTDAGTWKATLKGLSPVVTPEVDIPNARVLRRTKILALVDAEPVNRYKALSDYIELPGVSKAEATLRSAENTAKQAAVIAKTARSEAEKALDRLWEAEQKPDTSAIAWGQKEANRDLSVIATDHGVAKTLGKQLGDLTALRTEWGVAEASQVEAKSLLETARQELAAEEIKAKGQTSELVVLLEKAKTYIDVSEDKSCPVCQQSIDRSQLSVELQTRITAMETLRSLAEKAGKANVDYISKSTVASDRFAAYRRQYSAVATALIGSVLKIVKEAALPQTELSRLANVSTSDTDFTVTATAVMAAVKAVTEKLGEAEAAWSRVLTTNSSISTTYTNLIHCQNAETSKEVLATRLGEAYMIAVGVRKKFVQNELASISNEVDRLYGLLHPGEALGKIALSLDPNTQGSLHLTGDFYTETTITPQSLFSESHLDTLGFCVFFALAKKYNIPGTILLFDDIVTSVDSPHLDRFIDLLHQEAQHFAQIIVTTHYRPWRERYRHHRAPGGNVHFVDLRSNWTLERGIRAQTDKLALQELSDSLEADTFNRRDIADQSGIIVENILDFVTHQYGCRIARKPDNSYTLSELAGAINKDLLKALRVERGDISEVDGKKAFVLTKTEALEPIIQRLKGLSAVRNQVGCHFNFDGQLVTDGDVEEFGRLAFELGTLLVCPDKQDLPDRKKSGSFFETTSGKVRLHPLERPN